MGCVLCCCIGDHTTALCVPLALRPELKPYKEAVHLLPMPRLHLVCTRFLQFPGECSGLAS